MDLMQFDKYVLVPALSVIGLLSPSARVLMLGTGMVETNYEYLKQFNDGPALGIFEIEPATYEDVYRYLNRYDNRKLKEICMAACLYESWPDKEALIYNLRWSTIIARVKYSMITEPLPSESDAVAMAEYYKKYYNTAAGKAHMPEVTSIFVNVIQKVTSMAA
jgi:hypothetical protein